MTEAQRITFLVQRLEAGNQKSFALRTGISESSLSRIMSGTLHITKHIDTIVKTYPYVNRDWLETGEGYSGDLTVEMARERLLRIIRIKDETIETLRKELEIQQVVIEKFLKK